MRSTISFGTQSIQMGKLNAESSVPDLIGGLILQNELEFHLEEGDEIFGGYGRRKNSYPYRQFSCYSRELEISEVKTAVLENDYLKAGFLPELGGRLWYLWDKEKNRNLLYTNDVIRFSNLAVRNAWFSGGVEWNIGVIGHSPFTTALLFTAVLEDEKKTPILRMYEYERIRKVTYQMDFWLGENDRFLNARMRIVNSGDEVVPMYWWSNIAVPEHKNGRIIVPAEKAYTFRDGGVYKIDIPIVDGVDITKYQNIPVSVDYFFEIPKEEPKYIAHIDKDGYGLLHLSTNRLQSRKLFSWGNKRAADHWQEFLTKDAGRYIEIQAGLGKTQYGCLPMKPHMVWEWLERYGAIELEKADIDAPFDNLRKKVTQEVIERETYQEMEQVLVNTREIARKKAVICQKGSGYGALKNAERILKGKDKLSQHLDFDGCEEEQKVWVDFLKTGILAEPNSVYPPQDFMIDEVFFERLKESITKINKNNWYAHYHLGLFYFQKEEYHETKKEFEQSLLIKKTPWAYHGAACVYIILEKREEAKAAMKCGILMRKDDLSYSKESFRILSICKGFKEILEIYEELEIKQQKESRIKFYYIQALYEMGQIQKAYDLLCEDGGLVIDDVREGEVLVEELWKSMYRKLYGKEGELPYCFDFTTI